MDPAGEIWSVVTVSPSNKSGLASLIFLNPSGLSDKLSKNGGLFT